MESRRNKSLHLIVGAIIAIAVPLAIFPSMFGQQLLRASWQFVLYEAVLYGLVAAVVFRCDNLLDVAKLAGLSLAYRIAAGALFGLIITIVYSMDFRVAMTLAQVSYWPGVAIQIVLTPIALWPVLSSLADRRPSVRRVPARPATVTAAPSPVRAPFPATPNRDRLETPPAQFKPRENSRAETANTQPRAGGDFVSGPASGDPTGFDKAVRYVAEHGSVYFAAVVDPEGLLLAHHCRGRLEAEDIAPLAVTFLEWNNVILNKGRFGDAEKVDITMREKRLVLARVGDWCMMVLSERVADDLLNIRINQGVDMLKKYSLERYGSGRQNEVEKAYV